MLQVPLFIQSCFSGQGRPTTIFVIYLKYTFAPKITVDTKNRIIAAHAREDYIEVARILGVKRGTACSIVARNQANGGVPSRLRGRARNVRLDAEMQLKIVDVVERHPEFTLAQVNYQLQTDLPLKLRLSIQTMAACRRCSNWRSAGRLHSSPCHRRTQDAGLPRDDAVKLLPPYSPFFEHSVKCFSNVESIV